MPFDTSKISSNTALQNFSNPAEVTNATANVTANVTTDVTETSAPGASAEWGANGVTLW